MTLQILNVNSTLDLMAGGGTAERTLQMSRFLARENVECTVLTIDIGLDDARVAALKPARVVTMPALWRRFYVPKINLNTIQKLVSDADIIHLMGHWGVLNALVYFAARRMGKPYVVCPAGALPIFGRSALLKRLYNFLIGNAIIRNASAWIAVTANECAQFEKYGIPVSSITVIPNGVAIEDFPDITVTAFRDEKGLPDSPLILFMGRLNLIKGPDLLLQAFALIKDRINDFHLAFAGPDEGMKGSLLEFARQNGIADRVHFLDFVSGRDKVAAYRSATLLAVPSRQEAMSIVALEAGICGKPVLVTDQCGFGEITSICPALETTADAVGIAAGLESLITEPGRLARMGPLFRDFVMQRYTWESIIAEYLKLYKSILATRK